MPGSWPASQSRSAPAASASLGRHRPRLGGAAAAAPRAAPRRRGNRPASGPRPGPRRSARRRGRPSGCCAAQSASGAVGGQGHVVELDDVGAGDDALEMVAAVGVGDRIAAVLEHHPDAGDAGAPCGSASQPPSVTRPTIVIRLGNRRRGGSGPTRRRRCSHGRARRRPAPRLTASPAAAPGAHLQRIADRAATAPGASGGRARSKLEPSAAIRRRSAGAVDPEGVRRAAASRPANRSVTSSVAGGEVGVGVADLDRDRRPARPARRRARGRLDQLDRLRAGRRAGCLIRTGAGPDRVKRPP